MDIIPCCTIPGNIPSKKQKNGLIDSKREKFLKRGEHFFSNPVVRAIVVRRLFPGISLRTSISLVPGALLFNCDIILDLSIPISGRGFGNMRLLQR
jgi:hypothetical protein